MFVSGHDPGCHACGKTDDKTLSLIDGVDEEPKVVGVVSAQNRLKRHVGELRQLLRSGTHVGTDEVDDHLAGLRDVRIVL